MSDSIEEIRERHADAELIEYDPPRQMHHDRATLLAEVDRQREEIEKLRAENAVLIDLIKAAGFTVVETEEGR